MNYIVYAGSFQIGEVVAMNDDQALALAKNKYPGRPVDRVEQIKMKIDVASLREAKRYDWLGLGAKLSAVFFIYMIGFFHGMKVEKARFTPAPAKTEEVKVETPAKPGPIVTNIGRMTKIEPDGNDIRVTTENAVLYVNSQFPLIWTSQCHVVNDGQRVWFTEDGLALMYNITRQ